MTREPGLGRSARSTSKGIHFRLSLLKGSVDEWMVSEEACSTQLFYCPAFTLKNRKGLATLASVK